MTVSVDVWLRGTEHATTKTIDGLTRPPSAWTDDDVRFVLERMLGVMAELKQPGETPRTIALRGLSWTLIPASLINGTMLVSTIPHGGHHLVDLIAGGMIAACAIFFVRLPLGVRHHRLAANGAVGLAGA